MKYRLIIFDMDGTTLNTLEDLANSLNYALKNAGLPNRSPAEVKRFLGGGIQKLVERGVPRETRKETAECVLTDFMEHYTVHCADHTKPYDGILDLLRTLRKTGYRTAVVSNKADRAVQALCKEYFPGLFDAVAGEKPGIRKKPAPDSVNQVLEQLKTDRKDAVYIGDSEVDIETAKNAGMDCISVDWGFRTRAELIQAGATKILSHPMDIWNEVSR